MESDTVYFIKSDSPINEHSIKEDDGTYLTPQNKIGSADNEPSKPQEEVKDQKKYNSFKQGGI